MVARKRLAFIAPAAETSKDTKVPLPLVDAVPSALFRGLVAAGICRRALAAGLRFWRRYLRLHL